MTKSCEQDPFGPPTRPLSWKLAVSLGLGMLFGIVLTKAEVARWERVHQMFLFRESHMYLIIGLGVAVAAVSMTWLKRRQVRSMMGNVIQYQPRRFQPGVVIGGLCFGAGWAITGACPGPIYAQLGAGVWPALFTFAGALGGMFLFAATKPFLPGGHPPSN